MKKVQPNSIVDKFLVDTDSALSDWRTLDTALEKGPIGLRRRVAADAFLALAVSWEVSFSDWVVAAVNKDASAAVAHLTAKLTRYAADDLRIHKEYMQTKLISRSHFNIQSVRQLLDPNEDNIIIHSHGQLQDYAKKWLAGSYRAAIERIEHFDFQPIVATRVLRNVLAHQSERARTKATETLRGTNMPLELRLTGARTNLRMEGWRRYLHSGREQPRIVEYHLRLSDFARGLQVG